MARSAAADCALVPHRDLSLMGEPLQRARLTQRPLLFYVTDRRAFGLEDPHAAARLLRTIDAAARAGVDAVQLREKDLPSSALLDLARRGAVCCAPPARDPAGAPSVNSTCGARFLINDRLDVALAAGASGVHLAAESVGVADVAAFRAAGRAPADFLIGRSCHSLEEAIQAEAGGADYIFFGPVFATPSKARFGPPQGMDALAAVSSRVRVPVVAIGGITLENAASCLAAGAAGVAAIRLFQQAPDIAAVVKALKQERT